MQARLWRGLTQQQQDTVNRRYSWTTRHYSNGMLVALMGDPLDELTLVEAGSLSAEFPDPHGRLLKVETLSAGETIAGPVLFAGDPKLPVQLIAVGDVVLRSLAREQFLRLLAEQPVVLGNFLRESGDKISFLAEKLRMVRFGTLSQKIAAHLLRLYTEQGTEDVRLQYSLRELAELFGAERPSVSRSFAQLAQDNVLSKRSRGVYRIRPNSLRQLLTLEH